MSRPDNNEVNIESLYVREGVEIEMPGLNGKLDWKQKDSSLKVVLPESLPELPVNKYVLKLSNKSLIHNLLK